MDEEEGPHTEFSEDSSHSNNTELVIESNVSALSYILNHIMKSQAINLNKTVCSMNCFRMVHLIECPKQLFSHRMKETQCFALPCLQSMVVFWP